MDFNQLMARMRELDQPAQAQIQSQTVEACGDSMMGQAGPGMNNQMPPPPAHPSMSVNLNAQGMDNIESLMKLMTKVNPDMINQPAPPMAAPMDAMAMLTPPGPSISKIGDLGNLDAGPLKMLPDLDKDEPHAEPDADNMGGPSDMDADNMPPMGDLDSDDNMTKAMGDIDGDGDHDMDDHEAEKEEPQGDEPEEEPEEKKKDEAYGNSCAGGADTEYKDVDYMVNKLAGGMNGPKGTYPKVAGGDNPMQRVEGVDLKTSIKNELRNRLAEAKLAELSKDTLKSYKDKSDAAVGKSAAADKDDGKFAKRFDGGMKAQAKLDKKGDK
jgi:hypothetical protein